MRLKAMYIFDIDMTLADCYHRLHHIIGKDVHNFTRKDWEDYDREMMDDKPIKAMVELCRLIHRRYPVVLLTGRSERTRDRTIEWLAKQAIPYDLLLMRPEGDKREDTIVKLEVLDSHFSPQALADVVTIFEDRTRICEAFRARGFHVCQVNKGDY